MTIVAMPSASAKAAVSLMAVATCTGRPSSRPASRALAIRIDVASSSDRGSPAGVSGAGEALSTTRRPRAEAIRAAWAKLLADHPAKLATEMEAKSKLPVKKTMNAYLAATEELGHKWPSRYKLD